MSSFTPYEIYDNLRSSTVFLKLSEIICLVGVTVNHTAYFKKVRDTKIDNFAVETNKLIIRLDKLINEAPTDPSKRKGIFESKL